ncbi:MAG: ABC transporter permease [Clostridia bacterium]|nr:ABC transporter permease [Clostridia bacterium]MBN2883024.1 ABC transporter permease [Clostridia bacterium]
MIFIIIWEFAVRIFNTPEYRLPAPTAIIEEFIKSWEILLGHTGITFFETILGFIAGVLVAVAVAVLIDSSDMVERIFMPFAVLSQTIPLVALAPLLAIWFGFGILPKVILVILVVFFPVTVSLVSGFKSIDKDLCEMMVGMNASKWQIFIKLKVPGSLPFFFSGLKISAAYAVMGAVISEWTGASRGLGIYMTRAMSSFKTAALFADIIIISLLSILLFKVIAYLERKFITWK